MILKRLNARIASMIDLSPSAREITLTLSEPLEFLPGAFVNVFMTADGKKMRRAYSISSDSQAQDQVRLSIRKGTKGGMSERFWDKRVMDAPLEIIGPLGLNTADKITREHVFLFGFGIGVSVVKGLLHHLHAQPGIKEITIVTGSRTEDEILYKDFFEDMRKRDSRLTTRFVVSKPHDKQYPYTGHIQDHLKDFSLEGATAYICGAKEACASLQDAIKARAGDVEFLIEAFD